MNLKRRFKYLGLEDKTRMWICKECGFKNNNSSKRCHGNECKVERQFGAIELPKVLTVKKEKEYRAFCPKCGRPVVVVKSGRLKFRVIWRCNSCHGRFFGSGKAEEIKNVN